MRILGIDPGLTRCGLGVIDAGAGRAVSLVHVSVARTEPTREVVDRLGALSDAVDAIFDEFRPDAVALERVFAQHNVRTVMGTAQISGVVMVQARNRGVPVSLYTPSEVKAAVSGNGRATKQQVGFMVAKVLKLAAPPTPADAADALAIAIAHAWRGPVLGAAATPATDAQRRWAEADRAARTRN